jgi:hypothetical protein
MTYPEYVEDIVNDYLQDLPWAVILKEARHHDLQDPFDVLILPIDEKKDIAIKNGLIIPSIDEYLTRKQ